MGSINWLITGMIALTTSASALPIGFGKNQSSIQYDETKSPRFRVYHDQSGPGEGLMTIEALEYAKPMVERWLGVQREKPLPVVVSSISANASFANFITDAIELQTLGQGTKELAWHEFVHSSMYRNFDNIFGPAGNILHLPWIPAWYIEGLAEAFSVSVGSDVTAGIERYQALKNDWPTYDHMHSLYSEDGFAERGYATSGALVTYFIKESKLNQLRPFHDEIFRLTMPWWWPWSMVPFNGFMPFDQALTSYVGKNGENLYQAYKIAAKAKWQVEGRGPFLSALPGKRLEFDSLNYVTIRDGKLVEIQKDGEGYVASPIIFSAGTGWAEMTGDSQPLDHEKSSKAGFSSSQHAGRISWQDTSGYPESVISISSNGGKRQIKRLGLVERLFTTKSDFVWLEQKGDVTQLCRVSHRGGKISCPVKREMPTSLKVIGDKTNDGITEDIWIYEKTEKIPTNLGAIKVYNPGKNTYSDGWPRTQLLKDGSVPLKIEFNREGDIVLLLSERFDRTLRRMSLDGQCLGMHTFRDHITNLFSSPTDGIILGLYGGRHENLIKLNAVGTGEVPCENPKGPTSPILAQLKSKEPLSLEKAILADQNSTDYADINLKPVGDIEKPVPATWRPRPLFVFPWIGAEDALGPQLGIVSVPLMDEMQNETVRATMLYGVASRFPYQEVSLTSTRFLPTLNLALFRNQTYNGRFFKRSTGEYVSAYHDEKGVRFEVEYALPIDGGYLNLGGGIKLSNLKPYIGPTNVKQGRLIEPGFNAAMSNKVGSYSLSSSVSGRTAPSSLNREFDYNQIGGAVTVGRALPLDSVLSLGVEGSRTRGAKMRELKEVYRPLKTFVPGSGGGYNQNSFALSSAENGLFNPSFGDSQARLKTNWTLPLVPAIDKVIWILYLERLDFTAFYNYGDAWYGAKPAEGWDTLTKAHGYALDLQLENKGVRFNLGGGIGQVLGEPFEVYMTTGFDALF